MLNLIKFVKSKFLQVSAAIIVASCSAAPVPALAQGNQQNQQTELCENAVDAAMTWRSLLEQGATEEQVIQSYLKLVKKHEATASLSVIEVMNHLLLGMMANRKTMNEEQIELYIQNQCKQMQVRKFGI